MNSVLKCKRSLEVKRATDCIIILTEISLCRRDLMPLHQDGIRLPPVSLHKVAKHAEVLQGIESLPFEGHKKTTSISQQNLMKATRLPSAIWTHLLTPEDNSIAGKGFISPDCSVPHFSLFPEQKLSGSTGDSSLPSSWALLFTFNI